MGQALPTPTRFSDLVDAVDQLSLEEQMALVEIVRRRLIEHRRDQLTDEIQEARRDLQAGRCQPATPDEILRDLLS
jgi:uncharacterized protein YydD (DUF2326 family)